MLIVNDWTGDSSNPPFAVPPVSLSLSWMVAFPTCPAAGVKDSPGRTHGRAVGNRAVFDTLTTSKKTDCPASSGGPDDGRRPRLTVSGPES